MSHAASTIPGFVTSFLTLSFHNKTVYTLHSAIGYVGGVNKLSNKTMCNKDIILNIFLDKKVTKNKNWLKTGC